MKKRKVVDRETPEGRFTELMKNYTTLKKQRLMLLRGHLEAVFGMSLDYPPPLGEATIWLHDVEGIIEGETPRDLEQKIWRSAGRLQGLLLQVNTYWLKQAITQLYALGAEGDLNLDPLTEVTTREEEAQVEEFFGKSKAQLAKLKKMIKPRGGT
jgi:hypothetical protein